MQSPKRWMSQCVGCVEKAWIVNVVLGYIDRCCARRAPAVWDAVVLAVLMRERAVVHEGRALLGEVRGYSTGVGLSCSTDNPWPVRPRPRGVVTRARSGRSSRVNGRLMDCPGGGAVGRYPRESPLGRIASAAPGRGSRLLIVVGQEDREPCSPARAYFSRERLVGSPQLTRGQRSSCWIGESPIRAGLAPWDANAPAVAAAVHEGRDVRAGM